MKSVVEQLVTDALSRLTRSGVLPLDTPLPSITIERCRDPRHGDYACPVAMALARTARRPPREVALALVDALPPSPLVERVEVAGPGFINFRLTTAAFQSQVETILRDPEFGSSRRFAGRRVQVEFVSANPTGPLHVGHGRGAAYGAAVADLLAAVGYEVEREYYVNDAGRQMDILAVSVWLRYLELEGADVELPANAYRGEYVVDVARRLAAQHGEVFAALPPPPLPSPVGDPEVDLDRLVAAARAALGEPAWRLLADCALRSMVDDIESDLDEFGVRFDRWFSERSLVDGGALARALEQLESNGHTYREGGALWFRSTSFGDEKDRVLVRENGQSTYFASDVAYHLDKLERGFDRLIDVWGADHHGYISRVKGALEGLGHDPQTLSVLLVQFANLFRGGEKVSMSTRSGQFVTLRELREEVGNDAARFFYVMRKCDQHLDFDLDLAKSHSNDNPVYYVQYAHARIASVLRQLAERGAEWSDAMGWEAASILGEHHELDLLRTLSRFPEAVENAAVHCEPHQLAFFLREVANDFHAYYNAHTFLVDDEPTRNARVGLARATQTVIRRGLTLLGVSSPDVM